MRASPSAVVLGLALAAVVAAVAVGGVLGLGLGLLVATAARIVAGRPWFEARDREAGLAVIGGGAIVGALALAAALAASAPLADLLGRGVEWSTLPVVRGSIAQAATVALVVVAVAVACELGLRRGLLELVAAGLAQVGAGPRLATAGGIAAAALVEAALAPLGGDPVGVAVMAVGLGVIYDAAGRRLGAPLAVRIVFELGAVGLQALRLIG